MDPGGGIADTHQIQMITVETWPVALPPGPPHLHPG